MAAGGTSSSTGSSISCCRPLTLALFAMAGYSRYQRNAMLDVLGQDFIRTARAKGLTRRRALFKHGLRTALIPMATLFAYGIAGLVTGAVFVEKIFGWHGIGEWYVQSIATEDTNIVVAVTLFGAVMILVGGLLSDVILRGARSEGAGRMTQATVVQKGVDTAQFASRRTLVLRRLLRNEPAVVALILLVVMFVRLLCAATVLALQLHRFGLLGPAGAAVGRSSVRHQFAGPRSAGPDAAGHAEVDADRCLRGVHLGHHRSHGGNDRRILRRLARHRADVRRRPVAGGAGVAS